MLSRLFVIVLALAVAITFADWISSPVQPCKVEVQQKTESNQKGDNSKENCSAGLIVSLWRTAGGLIDRWHDDLTAAATVVIAIFYGRLGCCY
jgi:hypothetical protein